MDWYDTKTNAQKGMCMRELYNFTIGKEEHPVQTLYDIEDLRETLFKAGICLDDNNLYTCFVNALPATEEGSAWRLSPTSQSPRACPATSSPPGTSS